MLDSPGCVGMVVEDGNFENFSFTVSDSSLDMVGVAAV